MEVFYITHSMLERHASKFLTDARILAQCRRLYCTKRTHYDVLNLKRDCTKEEIRQSFAELSKKHHPDTSKVGNANQNSRKFQEIMEAYKVLNKKSSREAYDAEISISQYPNHPYHHPYHNPYYATYNRREQRFYEGDFASYQQHMHNMRQAGYYRNFGGSDNFWTPSFNKRRVYGFLVSFVLMNFFTVYIVYSLSTKNRIIRDFADERRRIAYEAHRRGIHGPRFVKVMPEIEEEDPLLTIVSNRK
ncbi:dnaJ homolog subfamily B member 9-like [Sitodiplosis mosellana]|uniref:dnaJ homolog subfamily B member 9-like n=1 Tax=Sitodiplosis mosellana TaxID=263140 RepID=UPI002443F807|nr:dnaJ homolog subfamily B member 9-like [Sitodiplosis mosellana]